MMTRNCAKIELWSVPTADAVIGAKVPLIGPEPVGGGPVPL